MATWIDDLESNIKSSLPPRRSVKKSSQDLSPIWLFGAILFLAVAVFTVVKFKSPAQSQWQQSPSTYSQQYPQQQSPQWTMPWQQQPQSAPATVEQKVDALKIQYDKLDAAAHKIWDRTKWNSDRMTLLATINNHNLVVTQQSYPKSELIYLNSDWTINRMPDRIQLDPQDQAFIKQFVRK